LAVLEGQCLGGGQGLHQKGVERERKGNKNVLRSHELHQPGKVLSVVTEQLQGEKAGKGE